MTRVGSGAATARTLPPPLRPEPRQVLPAPELRRLDNGLEVCVLPWRRAPVVAAAIVYRAGTLDERPEHGGTAHFLEHMMFKGSERFGPGEIDAVTRSLGGSNNAYTTHDATLYYFTFAADRWQIALDLEVDRLRGLRLDPAEVDAERQVIVEEIAMYEGEAWDALDQAVHKAFFGVDERAESGDDGRDAPYGRPVLGDRTTLERIDREVLGAFHAARYRPSNAVLTVVGDVDPEAAFDEVAARFAEVEDAGQAPQRPESAGGVPSGIRRVERRQGDMARLLIALPSTAGDHPDHPILRLLTTVLASGRASRLHRALVDDGELCVWTSADVHETLRPGCLQIACEVLPGVEPAAVEEQVLDILADLRREPPTRDEIARAQQIVLSDWISAHEKVDQLAFLFASVQGLWQLDHPWRSLERLRDADAHDLERVARTYLDPERGAVVGWSLPRSGRG